jgi:hypothetical protein
MNFEQCLISDYYEMFKRIITEYYFKYKNSFIFNQNSLHLIENFKLFLKLIYSLKYIKILSIFIKIILQYFLKLLSRYQN